LVGVTLILPGVGNSWYSSAASAIVDELLFSQVTNPCFTAFPIFAIEGL
jgi:hypothetical protein